MPQLPGGTLIGVVKYLRDDPSLAQYLYDVPSLVLQDTAAATASSVLPTIPGLPSDALTDLVVFLHNHPEVRSAVITFLQADSTKQFLATISSLAIKVNPAQVAGLVRHSPDLIEL